VSYALPDDVEIFYVGTKINKTSKRIIVAILVTTVFEHTGTFINKDWRSQKNYKTVNLPQGNIFPMWYVFSLLFNIYLDANDRELL
jgi:predicted molibdopterin-dependent oxidoreductase YjgC